MPQSSQLLVVILELEQTIWDLLNKAIWNEIEKPAGVLAFEHGISPSFMLHIL